MQLQGIFTPDGFDCLFKDRLQLPRCQRFYTVSYGNGLSSYGNEDGNLIQRLCCSVSKLVWVSNLDIWFLEKDSSFLLDLKKKIHTIFTWQPGKQKSIRLNCLKIITTVIELLQILKNCWPSKVFLSKAVGLLKLRIGAL